MSTRLMLAETPYLRSQPLDFKVGDTVDVATKIVEGEKERIQLFTGRVIRKRGEGLSANFTVRRIVMGEGVERIFPIHSPRVAGVKVVSRGEVRRSKLYYLRARVGKSTRLKEILGIEGVGGESTLHATKATAIAGSDTEKNEKPKAKVGKKK